MPTSMLVVGRLNDAMLMTRELVKQRWTPQAILSVGPGWYEDQYIKTLGKLSDGPISFVPWYDPNKKLAKALEAALAQSYPGINLNTNHVFTFEALLVAADAYKRAGSTDPKALADALRDHQHHRQRQHRPRHLSSTPRARTTKIIGGGIQNRGGKLVTIAPKEAANGQAGMADEVVSGSRVTPLRT